MEPGNLRESSRYSKRSRHGSFRVNFSALSLGGSHNLIFRDSYVSNLVDGCKDNGHSMSDSHSVNACIDSAKLPCFVTFAIKIYYKKDDNHGYWRLCSTVETKPILATFEEKQSDMVACLLNYTEKVPMFISKNDPISNYNIEGKQEILNSKSSSLPPEMSQPCRGSNHLLESNKFKIALGAAIVRSGKVLYVGHGSRLLRSIDLFGKRISLSIIGDSCNDNDYRRNVITTAYVFFDISVKYVQWVPCTKHCQLLNEISIHKGPQYHNEEYTEGDYMKDDDSLSLHMGLGDDTRPSRLDFRQQDADTPNGYYGPESQLSTFRDDNLSFTKRVKLVSQHHFRASSAPSSIYVGSDPRYRVSVLNINKLAGGMKIGYSDYGQDDDCDNLAKSRVMAGSLEERYPHMGTYGKGKRPQASKQSPALNSAGNISERTDNEPELSDVKERDGQGYVSDLLWQVFGLGSSDDHEVPGPGSARYIFGNLPPNKKMLGVTKLAGNAKLKAVGRGNNQGIHCMIRIGHGSKMVSDKSVFMPIKVALEPLLCKLGEAVTSLSHEICIRSVMLKPRNVDLFLFKVIIPEEYCQDLNYTRMALTKFHEITSHAIEEIVINFCVISSKDTNNIDEPQLRNNIEQIELECGLTILEFRMGCSEGSDTDADCRPSENISPLRKFHSEADLYKYSFISKTINRKQRFDGARCISETNDVMIDTWMNTISKILASDEGNELIQIQSPRTSLPINLDQKWVLLLRQLLSEIKSDYGPYPADEGVKFIWPTL